MIRDFFEKRRVRKMLSRYVSPEVVEDLLTGKTDWSDMSKLAEKQIVFFCIEVRGDTPELISERMGIVVNAAHAHGATVDTMLSGLVVAVYGLGLFPNQQEKTQELLAVLRERFPKDLRMIHGSGLAACGNLGSASRMSFSFILPGFLDALGELKTLSFEETREWKL